MILLNCIESERLTHTFKEKLGIAVNAGKVKKEREQYKKTIIE